MTRFTKTELKRRARKEILYAMESAFYRDAEDMELTEAERTRLSPILEHEYYRVRKFLRI